MHIAHLTLHDFRSYESAEVALAPGVTAFVGRNGHGKTNLVEAVDYVARLGSHRVAGDAALVRIGAERAVVRVAAVREGRQAVLEVEINPGGSNRARVNRSPLPRARDVLGWVRTVLFSPEDLTLVKGDPGDRRRFLDELLTLRAPRYAGVRSDYEKVLKQRNTLLRSMRPTRQPGSRRARTGPGGADELAASTLEVWDEHLARAGAELVAARLGLVADLGPLVGAAYESVARGAARDHATLRYQATVPLPEEQTVAALATAMRVALAERRAEEVERGVTLVGPHRDELLLALGEMPVRGYASQGESWSFALALRLASYDLLRAGGDDPVLILDDVFAELDTGRRDRLADLVAGAEQVLVTAAVPEDLPAALAGARVDVVEGTVRPGAA